MTVCFAAFFVFGKGSEAALSTSSCAAEWIDHGSLFESMIQYDDLLSKANPTVHVTINGQVVQMMLDTGASANMLWDASLIDANALLGLERVDGHVASAEAKRTITTLADGRGNTLRREFFLVPGSVLAEDGYAGLLSPQAVAGDGVAVIDLDENCFFTSAPFDMPSDGKFEIYRGTTISNPYGVMAIPVEFGGGKIPLLVDTGASVTAVLASLVATKPKSRKTSRAVDMFGAPIPTGEKMRLVDLKVNGRTYKSHPVIPRPGIDDRGVVDFGYIGMDILKNLVLYHDGARREFILLARRKVDERAVRERRDRVAGPW